MFISRLIHEHIAREEARAELTAAQATQAKGRNDRSRSRARATAERAEHALAPELAVPAAD
jgi:hypothetical protein